VKAGGGETDSVTHRFLDTEPLFDDPLPVGRQ
jgi:hypothetical protein